MGQAKNRGTRSERVKQAQARIRQIQKEHPEGSVVIGVNEDFDIPEWNHAVNRYVHFCSLYDTNDIPWEYGNGIKWGDYVVSFEPDAKGYFDKEKAYLIHYSKGTYYGTILDLMGKMIWDFDSKPLIGKMDSDYPEFIECVDQYNRTATQRAGWSSADLKMNSGLINMLRKVCEPVKEKEEA